jgi:hypothetical protein
MTSIYLKCDKCGETFDGGDNVRGISWSQEEKLQNIARLEGWTGPLTRESNNDLCPKCSLPTNSLKP